MPPTADEFRAALRGRFDRATEEGKRSLEIRSGDLHEEVGGYPGSNHRMRNCCSVMRSEMTEGDVEVDAPPKGDGASVVIRYTLPRNVLPLPELGNRTMEVAAYRLFYDNIHDFKTTAMHVDSEVRHLGVRDEGDDPVPGMGGRTHRDMWESMKAVSHFNLGTALELMLKLLLFLNNVALETIPPRERHLLTKLHGAIPPKYQTQLESTYQASRSVLPDGYALISWVNTASPTPSPQLQPPNRDITTLKGFFEYMDEDVMLWLKRYSWEFVNQGRPRHYLSDISVFVELINRVMRVVHRP